MTEKSEKSAIYDLGIGEAYPERNDRRVAALEATVNRQQDEIDYLRRRMERIEEIFHRFEGDNR